MTTDPDTGWQTLTGTRRVRPGDAGNEVVIPGTAEINVNVIVKGMADGEEIIPEFRFWLPKNEYEDGKTCQQHGRNERVDVTPDPVKVSADAKFNVQLTRNGYLIRIGDYDFTTGVSEAENADKGTVRGRRLVVILDEATPLAGFFAKTGDNNRIFLYAGLLIVAAVVLAASIIGRKKNRKEGKRNKRQ